MLQQERDDKEGKPHYAEEEKLEVRPGLEEPEGRDQQQVETGQHDRSNDDPGRRDLPEQPYPYHRSCSAQVNP